MPGAPATDKGMDATIGTNEAGMAGDAGSDASVSDGVAPVE